MGVKPKLSSVFIILVLSYIDYFFFFFSPLYGLGFVLLLLPARTHFVHVNLKKTKLFVD